MRVSVLQENLARELATVSRIVSSRPGNPVYSNIFLTTESEHLKLAAVNLEQGVSMSSRIGANVETSGSITIPAKEFGELVAVLPNGTLTLEVDDTTQTLSIESRGRAKTELKGIDAEQFAPLPELDTENAYTLPADTFQSMIDQTIFACAKDDSRPVLQGVRIVLEGNTLSMAGADGYRLALRTSELNQSVPSAFNMVVPAKTLGELARLTPDENNLVYLSVQPQRSQVLFKIAEIEVASQIIDGKFPTVENVIPKSTSIRVGVSTKDLQRACRYTEIFARNVNNTTRLNFVPGAAGEPGTVTVSANDMDRGNNEWTLDATLEGDAIEIGFNVRYLLDVLNVIKEDQIQIRMSASNAPGVVEPAGRDDFLYVLMPMNLK